MLPVVTVTRPTVLTGQINGRLPDWLLWPTPGQAGGPKVRLVEPAARSWRALCAAALQAGHTLKATSYGDSYRWYELQYTTFLARYEPDPFPGYIGSRYWPDHRDLQGNFVPGRTWYQKPNTAVAAVPGTSNHGWGLAVDTGEEIDGDAGTESLDTATLNWLLGDAGAFGWSWEVQSEPWHIRYWAGDAIPAAVLDYEKGLDDMTPEEHQRLEMIDAVTRALLTGSPTIGANPFYAASKPVWVVGQLTALTAAVARIEAALAAGGGTAPTGPVDLSAAAKADIRGLVDEELDEQSRAGADADQ